MKTYQQPKVETTLLGFASMLCASPIVPPAYSPVQFGNEAANSYENL